MNPVPIFNEARLDPKVKDKVISVVKSDVDVQRLKIEKLMKNPDKDAYIPEPKKAWKPKPPPEFVRDVMGSSAGAGSGEFHVYRHIRRREFSRQAFLSKEEKRQKLDMEYVAKQSENKAAAESATAKRRAKRQRKKRNRVLNQAGYHVDASSRSEETVACEEDEDIGNSLSESPVFAGDTSKFS